MIDPRWQACADAWGIGNLAAPLAPATRHCFRIPTLLIRNRTPIGAAALNPIRESAYTRALTRAV